MSEPFQGVIALSVGFLLADFRQGYPRTTTTTVSLFFFIFQLSFSFFSTHTIIVLRRWATP